MKKALILFIALSLIGCEDKKIDEDQTRNTGQWPEGRNATCAELGLSTCSVGGTLKIRNKKIVANLQLKTESDNFQYGGVADVVQANNLKGIVFMYHHKTDPNEFDDDPHQNGQISIEFEIPVPTGWKRGDCVRVMFANENNPNDFKDLGDYFAARLSFFKYADRAIDEYSDFNRIWNTYNPVQVRVCQETGSDKIPRCTKDDGVLSIR